MKLHGDKPTTFAIRRAPFRAAALALSDIKIAHSVFALPFAVLAAFLAAPAFRDAAGGHPPAALAGDARPGPQAQGPAPFVLQLGLIVLCMFFARTWAMLVNRLADWRFDRANPRTAKRAIARGDLSPRGALGVALSCAACFMGVCALFLVFFSNPWPLILGAPVLAWIAFYSFTKRFTALAHLFLGGALAASPIAAAIAIDPSIFFGGGQALRAGSTALAAQPLSSLTTAPARTILCLAGMVLFWVAGFDVAYALQDLDFDRRAGLRSIPARLGARGALWAARLFHLAAFALLLAAWRVEPRFGAVMLGAVALVGGLLAVEHAVLARRGVAGLPLVFFTLNGFISLTLGAAGCADVMW